MSFDNPTGLRIGQRGNLAGKNYHVVGRVVLGLELDADLVMLSDPRLRRPLLARWVERMTVWVEVPEDLPLEQRASLTAVRLIAEGAWFAAATDVFPPDPELRAGIRAITQRLLKD